MSYQSPRGGSSYLIKQNQHMHSSRVVSTRHSLENIPLQFIQPTKTQISSYASPKNKPLMDVSKNYTQQVKTISCTSTPRSSLSSLNPLSFLKNIDSKINSFSQQLYQQQSQQQTQQQQQQQFVKVLVKNDNKKAGSYASPLQSQNFLSKSPSNSSLQAKLHESQENTETSCQNTQKDNQALLDQLQKSQEKELELTHQLEQVQKKLQENEKITQLYLSNIKTLEKTIDSQKQNIQLQEDKQILLSKEIEELRLQLAEGDNMILQIKQQQQMQNQSSQDQEAFENVVIERDQLKKAMNDIFVNIEKVLQENQQLNLNVQEISKYKQINNILSNQIVSLEEDIEGLSKENEQMIEKYDKEIQQLQNNNSTLKIELKTVQESLRAVNKLQNNDINLNVKRNTEQNDLLNSQLSKLQNEKLILEKNSEKLLEQNEGLYQKIRLLNEKISILNDYMRKLELENQQQQLQIKGYEEKQESEWKEQIDELELRILDLVKENEMLGELLQHQQSKLEQQQPQFGNESSIYISSQINCSLSK